jgi:hypothetical protein
MPHQGPARRSQRCTVHFRTGDKTRLEQARGRQTMAQPARVMLDVQNPAGRAQLTKRPCLFRTWLDPPDAPTEKCRTGCLPRAVLMPQPTLPPPL